ncbi:MAG: hypothetical protein ABIO40_08605 [Devosia sp.]
MSAFSEAAQHERMRLMALISEANDKITELQDQVAADELRIQALEAYDRVKIGKASGGKGAKKVTRRPKSAPVQEPAPDS